MEDVLHIDADDLIGSFATCGPPSCLGHQALCEIGSYMFNVESQVNVVTHNVMGSAPVYQPCVSDNGVHIIMFGMNGGTTANILKVGMRRFKSNTTTRCPTTSRTSSTRACICSWCCCCRTTRPSS